MFTLTSFNAVPVIPAQTIFEFRPQIKHAFNETTTTRWKLLSRTLSVLMQISLDNRYALSGPKDIEDKKFISRNQCVFFMLGIISTYAQRIA